MRPRGRGQIKPIIVEHQAMGEVLETFERDREPIFHQALAVVEDPQDLVGEQRRQRLQPHPRRCQTLSSLRLRRRIHSPRRQPMLRILSSLTRKQRLSLLGTVRLVLLHLVLVLDAVN